MPTNTSELLPKDLVEETRLELVITSDSRRNLGRILTTSHHNVVKDGAESGGLHRTPGVVNLNDLKGFSVDDLRGAIKRSGYEMSGISRNLHVLNGILMNFYFQGDFSRVKVPLAHNSVIVGGDKARVLLGPINARKGGPGTRLAGDLKRDDGHGIIATFGESILGEAEDHKAGGTVHKGIRGASDHVATDGQLHSAKGLTNGDGSELFAGR
mmetsp:Transcript_27917/g.51591  ORF Transcript_27917/g.51591 Transcript_27917/m.51591 type:complete len:212 (-) Transcript_27917:328-963(-)